MKKNKFISLLKTPEKIREKEIEGLEDLAIEFPYSQAIHVMLAKGAINCENLDSEKKLNHAAVYTADRKNLKQIIENIESYHASSIEVDSDGQTTEIQELADHDNLKGEITEYIEKLRKEKLNLQFQSDAGISEEAIEERNNFINDLDLKIIEAEVKLSKLQGSENTPDNEAIPLENDGDKPIEHDQTEDSSPAKIDEPENPVYSELEENLKVLKNYKENNERKSDNEKESDEEGTKTPSETINTLSNNVERERMEEYLASLKATEPENISNEKLKEQIKIINKFIENDPKLSRLEREEGSQGNRIDLSLRSLQVHQNIASENLALIMVKQGKLEKAEEIYNKLIWKFPEKKAYFVARIEELKKK